MNGIATVTSKGQVTLPIMLRRELGIEAGDQIEFVTDDGVTTLRRVPSDPNPFDKWAGRLSEASTLDDAVAWQRDLRDDE
jgi:antitoxin PrlF